MRYSLQPRDRLFIKGYEFLSFAENMGKNIGKNISKNLSSKYNQKNNQKPLDHAKKSATDAFETGSKRTIQTIAEATGDLIGKKIANRNIKVSKNSQQNKSELVTNEHDEEIYKQRYIYPEKRQEIIDELRFKIM